MRNIGPPGIDQALRPLRRAAQSVYWRVVRHRDPLDPWRTHHAVDPRAHEGKLTCGSHYRPLTLQVETVNTCNNLCVICAYPLHLNRKVVMPMDIFEKVLSDYSAMGGGYMSMTPVTGDILLDKHLLERLDLVKKYPAIREIGVTTNAAMLDRFSDCEVHKIVDSFGKIQISIYGIDEEEYISMTKRNSYRRAVEGVRRILGVRTKNIYLAFRLLKPRSKQDLVNWIEQEVSCKEPVEINSIMTGGYANFSGLDTSKALPFGATWNTLQPTKTQCMIPLLAVQVSSNGEVSFCPCVGAREDLILGNISRNTLLEIYNSSKTRALWEWSKYGIPKSCAACSFYVPIEHLGQDPSIIDDPFKMAGA